MPSASTQSLEPYESVEEQVAPGPETVSEPLTPVPTDSTFRETLIDFVFRSLKITLLPRRLALVATALAMAAAAEARAVAGEKMRMIDDCWLLGLCECGYVLAHGDGLETGERTNGTAAETTRNDWRPVKPVEVE